MNKELQRIKIAEACGWSLIERRTSILHGKEYWLSGLNPNPHKIHDVQEVESGEWRSPNESDYGWEALPDYLNDLNAIHAAILQLVTSKLQRVAFSEHLMMILNRNHDGEHRFIGASPFHHATAEASELCEALLIQQRLWTPTGEENE